MRRAVPILLVACCALSGCGSSQPTVKPSDAEPSVQSALRYVKAFTSADADHMAPMLANAAPGSPAQRAAQYYIAEASAFRDSGHAAESGSAPQFTPGRTTVKVCFTTTKKCVTYGNFKIDRKTGRLIDLTANGKPFGKGIVLGSGATQTIGDAQFRLVAASDDYNLVVVIEAKSGTSGFDALLSQASYVDSSGHQLAPSSTFGPSGQVQPRAKTLLVVIFPHSRVGGHISFPVVVRGSATTDLSLEVR